MIHNMHGTKLTKLSDNVRFCIIILKEESHQPCMEHNPFRGFGGMLISEFPFKIIKML